MMALQKDNYLLEIRGESRQGLAATGESLESNETINVDSSTSSKIHYAVRA